MLHLRKVLFTLAMGCVGLLALTATVESGDKKSPATTPAPRESKDKKPDPNWIKRHDGFVERVFIFD